MAFQKGGGAAGHALEAEPHAQSRQPVQAGTPAFARASATAPPFASLRASKPLVVGDGPVRKLLMEGDFEGLSSLGIAARPSLFRILVNPKEEWLARLSCAESILGSKDKIRDHERAMAFLAVGNPGAAASIGISAVLTLASVMKNRFEQMLLRNNAVLALASFAGRCGDGRVDLAVVSSMSAVLSSKSDSVPLRCNIAYEIVRVGALCDDAKLRMVKSALERAAEDTDDTIRACAEDALNLLNAMILEKKGACAPEDAITQRLPAR